MGVVMWKKFERTGIGYRWSSRDSNDKWNDGYDGIAIIYESIHSFGGRLT